MDAIYLCSDQTRDALPEPLRVDFRLPLSRQLAERTPRHLLLARIPADEDATIHRYLEPPDARAVLLAGGSPERVRILFRTLDAARCLAELLSYLAEDGARLRLGLVELLINAVEHGSLGIGGNEKSALCRIGTWEDEVRRRLAVPPFNARRVALEVEIVDHDLVFHILDQGNGFDWRSYCGTDPAESRQLHGRGITLARALVFYKLSYQGSGNQVVARYRNQAAR